MMAFRSILFANGSAPNEAIEPPAFFPDLNLDQVIEAIAARKDEYNLKPFFYAPLTDTDTILYRHEVLQDLDTRLLDGIGAFAEKMVIMRRHLASLKERDFATHKQGWFLEAALVYGDAVSSLAQALEEASLTSRGLTAFRAHLKDYVKSDAFTSLVADATRVKAGLAAISYCVEIRGLKVRVRKCEGEPDYSAEVEKAFEKFRQGAVKDYRFSLNEAAPGMNRIDAQIVDGVGKLYPEAFADLRELVTRHASFLDETILTFDREIQFYVAYLIFMSRLRKAGLPFCYPDITEARDVYGREVFDIALASKLVREETPVVRNDFYLQGEERVIVVTGPNQGGKTTFARTFGQLHYLASIGCPVPGTEARLALYDRLLTHFEREEDIKNLRGKLQDDLVRIHATLEQATPRSILILNEVFSSTTLQDAIFLSQEIMSRINELDCLCVWVTFVDEIASFSEKTVSMVSTVAPDNPALRTFRIVREPANGLAYALSIAEKHQVTYRQIVERIDA